MKTAENNITDLLEDESFLGWYFKNNTANVIKWDAILIEHPERKPDVDKAVQLLNALQITERTIDAQQITKAEKRLLVSMGKTVPKAKVIRIFNNQVWKWAAASVILMACITIWFRVSAKNSIDTSFAQIKEQQLPDGSNVVLNAHSQVTYSKQWSKNNKDREVWIKGEAFFHVKKTATKTRFIVHTTQYDIVVTGTQFNVNERDEQHPKVVLREGSITIKMHGAADIYLKPGESFELSDDNLPIKKTTNPDVPMAWIDKKLIFDNAPMSEVKKQLEDIYGAEVVFADDNIANEHITGIMPNDNLEVFIKSLQATMEYNVVQKGQVLTISKIQ